jgi:hypothetical protein
MKQLKSKQAIFLNFILISSILVFVKCGTGSNKTKSEDNSNNFEWLFDGSSVEHWRELRSEEFPKEGWKVENETLTVLGKHEDQPAGKDIITRKMYSNFDLRFEFNLTPVSNSGVKYLVRNDFEGVKGRFFGLEYQLVDDENYPDAQIADNRKTGAVYELFSAPEEKNLFPPGEWNSGRIVVNKNIVEHWLNGQLIIT